KGWAPRDEGDGNKIETAEQETDQPQVAIPQDQAQTPYCQVFAGFRVVLIRRESGTGFDEEIEEQTDDDRVAPAELPHRSPTPMKGKEGSDNKHGRGAEGYPNGPDPERFTPLFRSEPQGYDVGRRDCHKAQTRPFDEPA